MHRYCTSDLSRRNYGGMSEHNPIVKFSMIKAPHVSRLSARAFAPAMRRRATSAVIVWTSARHELRGEGGRGLRAKRVGIRIAADGLRF